MKKFKVAPHTAKRMKAMIATAMALTLAVPTSVYFSSKEASAVQAEDTVEVPEPIMKVDFEKGFLGEQEEHNLSVVKSEEVLKFAELKDANNSYLVDANGNNIFELTDTPFVESDAYKYGVVGNQPTTAFDNIHKNVLMLDDSFVVEEFKKKVSDKYDTEFPVGSVLQKALTAESVVALTNPFAGKDLKDANEYGAGVTISYWVYAPSESTVASDSSLITFNNSKRNVIQRDDLAKHNACVAYDEAREKNDTATLADYSVGTQKIVTDADGNTYTLYENYGKLVRLNPDYPVDSDATKKGGWYAPTNKSDGKITVTDAEDNTYKIASLTTGTTEDVNQYQYFRYLYSATDDTANGYSSKSKIRNGVIKGSMGITAQNDFHFREDNYLQETLSDASVKIIAGATVTNPNSDKDGTIQDFYGPNQFYFDGDETVTKNPNTWHYVTFVIQNDWVEVYVDGVWQDPESEFRWWKDKDEKDFGSANAGNNFNSGNGLRSPFNLKGQVTDWSAAGTLSVGPGNGLAIKLLDWLTDKDTELLIGKNGYASDCVEMDKGTKRGTLLDDLTFYDVPLTEEQAVQAYNNAKAESDKVAETYTSKEVPEPVTKISFDDGSMNGTNGYSYSNSTTNLEGKDPSVASDAGRGNGVLKIEGSRISGTSAVKLSKNPFAEKDLTGATISYWMKMSEPAKTSPTISFVGEKKKIYNDKIQDIYQGKEASSFLQVTSSMDSKYMEGYTAEVGQKLNNVYDFSITKNSFTDPNTNGGKYDADAKEKLKEYTDFLISTENTWKFVTAVFTNYEIQIFVDGVQLSNNKAEKDGRRTCYGPRMYDGYYEKMYSGFAGNYNNVGSNNQFATPLMTFLTEATTTPYVGFAYVYSSDTTYEKTVESYFDNIAYYDVALTPTQVKALYDEEVKPDGEETPAPTATSTVIPTPGPSNETDETDIIVDAETGSMEASYGGVKFNAEKGVIDPTTTQLTLGRLGTEASADVYSTFTSKLDAIKDFTTKGFVVYTATAKDASDAAVTANGKFKLTFDIPSDYDAKSVAVVDEDGTIYQGTVSEDGSKITIETSKFGNYAVVQKDMSTDDGSTIAGAASKSAKTGDTANVVIPFMILAIAGATLVVAYKKRAFEK